jgi:hypothetical protein
VAGKDAGREVDGDWRGAFTCKFRTKALFPQSLFFGIGRKTLGNNKTKQGGT